MHTSLLSLLSHYRTRPFIWGESDCFLFAAHVMDSQFATHYYPTHKGQYTCKRSALVYLHQLTGKRTLADALQHVFAPTLQPQRGIITLREGACGVYLGQHTAFRTTHGLTFLKSRPTDHYFKAP